jgi:hypothetical protein
MKLSGFVFTVLFLLSSYTFCQTNENKSFAFTGNLIQDSRSIVKNQDEQNKVDLQVPTKRSPYIAGLLSVILPGAGQYYNESYWKTAIFASIEATAIYFGLKYNKKGDDQTDFFQNFADSHWSVSRYADWTIKNAANINSTVDVSKFSVKNADGSVNWSQLNSLEQALGSGYSHSLPHFGDQQYYELIGKYPQYSHGWDDANQSDIDFHILSSRFLYYSDQRGKANDYYDVAAKAVVALYMNHIISAIEAIWESASYNKKLSANFSYKQMPSYSYKIDYAPTINLCYNF